MPLVAAVPMLGELGHRKHTDNQCFVAYSLSMVAACRNGVSWPDTADMKEATGPTDASFRVFDARLRLMMMRLGDS